MREGDEKKNIYEIIKFSKKIIKGRGPAGRRKLHNISVFAVVFGSFVAAVPIEPALL